MTEIPRHMGPGSLRGSAAIEVKPRLIGARVKRVEDPRLLTGKGRYVDDISPHGVLYVAFRRSEHSHALINSIDISAAKDMPGVFSVITGEDVAKLIKPVVATSRMKNYQATAMYPLAVGKVRFVGEPVVAVVATSRYLAEDAAEVLEIDYEPLPVVIDPEAAILPGAPKLHEDLSSNVLLERTFSRGDVEQALAGAVTRVSAKFKFGRKSPVAIENRSYLAEFDAARGQLLLSSSTQIPGVLRDCLVELLDIPGNRLRVVAPDVGGGFGGKGSIYPEEILVCLLSKHFEKPIKWTSDRLEDLSSTSQGFDEIVEATLGLDAEGKFVGLRAEVIGDVGAYSIYPWTAALEPVQVVSFLSGPYKIENYRGRVQGVTTSKSPTGPYRGVGRPISTFVTERLVDMAAQKTGIDPVELRLKNLVKPHEFPFKTGSGIVWDSGSFVECLEGARDAIGYEKFRAEQVESRKIGKFLGIGFSSYAELTGIGSRISVAPGMPINTGTETATIRVDSAGSITAVFGVASHGQSLETTLAQVVADELGARLEDIRVVQGDTADIAHSTGTYASRSAVLAGGAATLASRAVKEKLIKIAAQLLQAEETDIDISDGLATARGTNSTASIKEMARAFYSEMGRLPKDLIDGLEATKQYDPFFGTTTSATHVAVVEVDQETCKIKLLHFVVVEDCGRIINPLVVDGQVHGGVAQGIGAALFERMLYDDTGQLITASLADYLVPSAPEIPPMEVHHVEKVSPTTLGGFRGMGEGGTIGAPAAVVNAIADALSHLKIQPTELPVTPDKLFHLIQKSNEGN
jgi:carbon-monoxide dehydrogenase large subunit